MKSSFPKDRGDVAGGCNKTSNFHSSHKISETIKKLEGMTYENPKYKKRDKSKRYTEIILTERTLA